MSDSCLEQLIAEWLDGRLNAEGSQALQQLLLDSAEARSTFRKYALLDVSLHEAAATSRGSGVAERISVGVEQGGLGQPVGQVQRVSLTPFLAAKRERAPDTLRPDEPQRKSARRIRSYCGVVWGDRCRHVAGCLAV